VRNVWEERRQGKIFIISARDDGQRRKQGHREGNLYGDLDRGISNRGPEDSGAELRMVEIPRRLWPGPATFPSPDFARVRK